MNPTTHYSPTCPACLVKMVPVFHAQAGFKLRGFLCHRCLYCEKATGRELLFTQESWERTAEAEIGRLTRD